MSDDNKPQNQLDQYEVLFRNVIDKSADGIVIVDMEGVVRFFNPSAEQLFGRKTKDIIGELFGFPVAGGETTEIEIIGSNKKVRFAEMRVVETEWEDEAAYLASIRDITEHKKADEFIKSIFENIGEGVVVIDRQYRIITANRSYCNKIGMPIEDIKGRYCYEVSHRIDRPCHMVDEECPVKYTFETGQTHTHIHKHYHTHYDKEGPPFYVEIKSYPIKDPSGKVISAIEIIADITKTIKLEKDLENKVKELQESEERIKRDYHIQSTINSILRISLEPISLKEQLERILDLILSIPWLSLQAKGCIFLVEDEPDVLVNKVHREFSEVLLRMCTKVPFGRCLCGRAASTHELIFADCVDDRHEVCYQGMLPHGHYNVPILSGDRVLGVICMYVKEGHKRDQKEEEFLTAVANTVAGVIEREQAEDELKRYHGHLEELVKERTETLNKQRESFISVLIHDLKGPLLPIMGYTQRLIDGKAKSKEDTIRILKIAQESSQNLLEIIESISKDLREKSSLESFHPEDIDFCELVTSVTTNFIPKMEEKGIEILINHKRKESWNELGKVLFQADSHQLKTFLENLLRNAIKYAKSKINVSLNKSNSFIHFVISDDGPGIPKKYQERIFEEYFQVPGSKKGTGIGLYSVKKVIENHKGKICVHSSPKKGATFEIKRPIL